MMGPGLAIIVSGTRPALAHWPQCSAATSLLSTIGALSSHCPPMTVVRTVCHTGSVSRVSAWTWSHCPGHSLDLVTAHPPVSAHCPGAELRGMRTLTVWTWLIVWRVYSHWDRSCIVTRPDTLSLGGSQPHFAFKFSFYTWTNNYGSFIHRISSIVYSKILCI